MSRSKAKSVKGLFALFGVAALFMTVTIFACGELSSADLPSEEPSLVLEAPSQGASSDDGSGVSLKANGVDAVGLKATVRGLSTNVGFYIPPGWGSFSEGEVGVDGYTYITADSDGEATITLISGSYTGRVDVSAKSNSHEARLTADFLFATITLYPSSLTLADQNGAYATVTVTGHTQPVWWVSSYSAAIYVTRLSETEARVFVHNATLFDSDVTITATDAEGQKASLIVTPGLSACVDATFALSNSTPSAGDTVSLTLDDYDRKNLDSVDVIITGADTGALTLTEWMSPGVFQGTYTIPAAAVSGDSFTFSTVDSDSSCVDVTISVTATIP